jgi:hypothetical protein
MKKIKDELANNWADWLLRRLYSHNSRGLNKFYIQQALDGYHEAKINEQKRSDKRSEGT